MNEFKVIDKLKTDRKEIKTFEGLVNFLKEARKCRFYYSDAIAQATLATAWYFARDFGVTSSQAYFVMWDFIIDWMYTDNKCGLGIVDYDNMLYPQYSDKFEKTILPEIWLSIQEQAEKNLKDSTKHINPSVIDHWKSITKGIVPFGYSVKEERCDYERTNHSR